MAAFCGGVCALFGLYFWKVDKIHCQASLENIGGLEFLRGANAEGGGLVGKADSMFVEERRALVAEFLVDDFSKDTF